MTAYNHTRKDIYYFWTTVEVDKTLYPFTQQQNFMPLPNQKKKKKKRTTFKVRVNLKNSTI